MFLKILGSPKCKAQENFASIRYADCLPDALRSAAYVWICEQENFRATQQLG
jgi:hypothetical protein